MQITTHMRRRVFAVLATAALVVGWATRATSADRATGRPNGAFYEQAGAAIKGYDPVAFFTDKQPVKGSPEHTAEYKGSVFHFSSQANRDAFTTNPAQYAPQYHGFCAFGVARGYKAATDPAAFTVVDNKLYLNYNKDIQKQWSADIPGLVARANKNWPEVSRQTRVIE
jgi:YHS domain-containing protein